MALNLLNLLLRELGTVNPVRLGKSMLFGASIPIALVYLVILGIFALFLLCGLNTWPLVAKFAHDSTIALSPFVATFLGSWMLYAYMYAAVLFIPLALALALTFALTHTPEILVQFWDDATGALLSLRDRIVMVWAHLTDLSTDDGVPDILTNSLQVSLPTGIPGHLATGWKPSTHPMLA